MEMHTPPFPHKQDVLQLFQTNDICIICALLAVLILVGVLCHDMPAQYTKSKAVALVLMQVVMISPYILWDKMISPYIAWDGMTDLHSVLMSGYWSWFRYLWCWHQNLFPFQFLFALVGVVYFFMYKQCKFEMPTQKSVYSCLAPVFRRFIEYLDNDMEKSMVDHFFAKAPVFFIVTFFRLCENAMYEHTVPLMSSCCLVCLAYDYVCDIVHKKFTKKVKKKTK